MTALICGSVAYDHIMVFPDYFKNHILPDKIHMLNVSFLVPDMRREFGGCAGNIAYTLKLLGGDGALMATVGSDFSAYEKWLAQCGISSQYIKEIDDSYTGQAFITTDQDDNQITAFHPGAMGESQQNKVADAEGVTIGIVSPDGRDGMIEHARQFSEANIPFIFDPGQGMPMFSGDDLKIFLKQATWLTVNDYEMQLFLDKTGMTPAEVAEQVEALVITRGSEGAEIITRDSNIMIPVVEVDDILDPTGCGDAFRSGLLYGLMNDLDWEVTGRIASLLGAIKITHHGTQNHHFTMAEFKARFKSVFDMSF
ncbi:MAG: carbohydrate kinase family protein [gamma proteobacterium symbiont of Bathyaustriella thionipta]|nr:carbohydrate kinase family protein [gamma proteobacterium symbiont of Bathyaustriella thionipta]MCU7948476.1 carbohydrate kinase family protein [gamma proteobacterium symbiont of Bathyaustriella thionipta]MCU7952472.1 carbohydrate kinase family protein [gamma proteobacterium symbiont of Bathyaustriella thionipta]MCU7956799.1 carbohydrate kinase family protein [gamma proteobacterium symbiont of Bathyaustriella thionipta]MCU7967497.1 carbohydrate kinase family protein [gamma proteobacterium sy